MEIDSLPENPFELFKVWFDEYKMTGPKEPTAMTLATATKDGIPSARVVLLKGYDEKGFTFFTNYESRKSVEMESNPHAQLLFFWEPLARQVRIYGELTRTTEKESDDYFKTRHYLSQLGAWASQQSSKLTSRQELMDRFESFKKKYPEGSVPRPLHWGGWRLKPKNFEFWLGRDSRLHDRFVYEINGAAWHKSRLSP